MIVTDGYNLMAALMAGENVSLPRYIAVGNGFPVLEPVPQDTALQLEVARVEILGVDRIANQLVFQAQFEEGVVIGPLTEAGLFTEAVGGICVARWLIENAPEVPADKSFKVTWTMAIGA